MDERLLIGILHLNVRHGAVSENRASLLAHAEEAAAKGARIIVAPELALSGYSFDSRENVAPYVEELTGETVAALSQVARRFGVYVCTGIAEEDKKTGIFYNSAVVIGPDGGLAAHHRKHVAERRWSCPGQPLPTSVFDTPWGRIGLLICADSYYGLLPRSMVLHNAALFLICANWPLVGLDPREVWRARALENGVGVIAANRTGLDRRMDCRTGPSYALTPEGATLLDAASDESAIHFVEYPLEQGRFPSRLRDEIMAARRPRDYNAIALDTCCLDEYPGMWGLPAPGSLSVRFFVPPPGMTSLPDTLIKQLIPADDNPLLLVLPPAMNGIPVQEFIRRSGEQSLAVVTDAPSFSGESIPALISEGRLITLLSGANSVVADFSHARIAVVRSSALRHPEQAVALSKQGTDIIVSQVETLDDDARLLLGVKCLERAAVVVAASDGATVCVPPEGHERWDETMRTEPCIFTVRVDTARTRKKRFLDRVDLEVLLRR